MAQRHWLDPLARRLLQATGQLPAPPSSAPPSFTRPSSPAPSCEPLAALAVERELVALKLRQIPALPLRDAAEVQAAAALGWRLDVNRASRADWQRLPGIAPAQVDLLLRLQAGGVQLSGADDLQRLLELDPARLACWQPVLVFRWYGEPPATAAPAPLDLNRASAAQLSALGLSAERGQRLLRERARRPFRDLAELQERLQLPAALVESWIGRVCFSAAPAGPVLPPPRRR